MIKSERLPKPDWLRVRLPGGENYKKIKSMLRTRRLHTVCEEANCPNLGECWGGGTATIMVLGDTCTRGCRFCNVNSGNPQAYLDPAEPHKVARTIQELELEYVVLTTVDRDDLEDQGCAHFSKIIERVREVNPNTLIETLGGDFQGQLHLHEMLADAGPEVYAHNIETISRLTKKVRDRRAGYDQSLSVLAHVKKYKPSLLTKSSIMVGLGETEQEVFVAMRDLRDAGVDVLTLGQYLQPSKKHLPVVEYVHPDTFKAWEAEGLRMGFRYVASGPLVRSSYKAGEFFIKNILKKQKENVR